MTSNRHLALGLRAHVPTTPLAQVPSLCEQGQLYLPTSQKTVSLSIIKVLEKSLLLAVTIIRNTQLAQTLISNLLVNIVTTKL